MVTRGCMLMLPGSAEPAAGAASGSCEPSPAAQPKTASGTAEASAAEAAPGTPEAATAEAAVRAASSAREPLRSAARAAKPASAE